AGLYTLDLRAIDVQSRHLDAIELKFFVPFEAGISAVVAKPFGHFELTGGTCLLALTRHGGIEAGHIDLDLTFATNIGRQVNRETVRVVQREQRSAIELATGRYAGQRAIENL